jgi:hypothetical protein
MQTRRSGSTARNGRGGHRSHAALAGETIALPGRINGLPIVAAVKLPTHPREFPHQWVVVAQASPSQWVVMNIHHVGARGFQVTDTPPKIERHYEDAVLLLVQRFAFRLEKGT